MFMDIMTLRLLLSTDLFIFSASKINNKFVTGRMLMKFYTGQCFISKLNFCPGAEFTFFLVVKEYKRYYFLDQVLKKKSS